MQINRMTVDKLGVKLYDMVYAVLAELISNSYDADARLVTVRAPMGQYLAARNDEGVQSKNVVIEVEDDGIGMEPQELQDFYLVVGKERRSDPKCGGKSKKYGRAVMGRKGVGKLAPFGVCRFVEIMSAGGEKVSENGAAGFRTAHIIMDKNKMIRDTSDLYFPDVGSEDGTLSEKTYTKVILREFDYRKIGSIEELSRQLAQRFGLETQDWHIKLIDTSKTHGHPESSATVGKFNIDVMDNSKIRFEGPRPTIACACASSGDYVTWDPDGSVNDEILPGFCNEGTFYPVTGWVAYSKVPYKDELMSGIRIYCRGKFSAQTVVFNRKAGFTGEHSIRSYLVGELHADWLDEAEDLIQTDRRDILWSHELGALFQEWGQIVVKHVGTITRNPMRQSMADKFFETGDVIKKIEKAFPAKNQKSLRDTAIGVAKLLGRSMRGDELSDLDMVEDMVQLCILLAPIQNLDEKLREAAETDINPLRVINDILKTARLAETVTFGHQVVKRLEIIDNLESLKDMDDTPESDLQNLIESAPWLINPQWIPVTANQGFTTLKREFEKYFKDKTGDEIYLSDFPETAKRPDFVSFSQDGVLQLIEIKRPKHSIDDKEWERVQTYFDQLKAFFEDHKHKSFLDIVSSFHITIVCDAEKLKGSAKKAYDSFRKEGLLTVIGWSSFLLRTKQTHQVFLDEAERLKSM
jgi:hypothetical protein